MLLYIHVPFCRAKCRYCAFYSLPAPDAAAVKAYTGALLEEIALWGERIGRAEVRTVFFGGGTPSLLPLEDVAAIFDRIHRAFAVDSSAEISFEANPDSLLVFGYAHELVSMGVTRLSLGVQSLDDGRLAGLGRPHTAIEARGAYDAARDAGFRAVSLDLMWGLPGQRRHQWLRELAAICSWKPDHLSCYGLTVEEGTPLAAEHDRGEVALPDDRNAAGIYVHGAEYLESEGYLQYEISSFARMGFQCRHNLGYWENEDYLGFGPAAASTFRGRRWTNPADIAAWARQVREKSVGRGAEVLDLADRVKETVMLRLRTTRGLRLKAFRDLTGTDLLGANPELFRLLHRQGLIRIQGGYLRLTRNGMLVSNAILEHLFATLEQLSAETDRIRPSG